MSLLVAFTAVACTDDAMVLRSIADTTPSGGSTGMGGGSSTGGQGNEPGSGGAPETSAGGHIGSGGTLDASAGGQIGSGGAASGGMSGSASTDGGPDASVGGGVSSSDGSDSSTGVCSPGVTGGSECVSRRAGTFDDGVGARCEVRADHTLWCWGMYAPGGRPTWQEPRLPLQVGTDADWTSVSVQRQSVCGLRGTGSLWCFGRIDPSGLTAAAFAEAPVQIGTAQDWAVVGGGPGEYLAVKQDGTLWRWGNWYQNTDAGPVQLKLPDPVQQGTDTDWATVTMGMLVGCAIKTGGALYCLGHNSSGVVGNGTTSLIVDELTPVSGGGSWTSIAVGSVACGVRTDGTLWCWGPTLGSTPVQIGTDSDWVEVAGHDMDVVGRRRSGGVYSILNSMTGKVSPDPIDPIGRYRALSGHCAQRDDGSLWCWESYAPRGDGSGNVEMTPVRVGTESDWVSVKMNFQEVFGLHANGRVDPQTWSALAALSPVKELDGNGENNACAIRTDGTMWCVGDGYGSFDTPMQQGTANDWLHLEEFVESWHCAIRGPVGAQQGTLWCSWPFYDPAWEQVGTDANWTSLSMGDQMCGLRSDGTVWCWGMQAVQGGPISWKGGVSQFAQYGSYQDWTAFASGVYFRCGIRSSGQLWCSGKNDLGQLGNGTHVDSATPTQVLPGTQWSSITAHGGDWACGIQVDGSLWCWGNDVYGQLGGGAPGSPRFSPQRVGSFNDWQLVTAGGAVTCGIRHQGELYCWGENIDQDVTHTWPRTFHAPVQVKSGPAGGYPYCYFPQDNDRDGYADCYGDCDDNDFDVSPSSPERCNGIDDNCNAQIDEGCP